MSGDINPGGAPPPSEAHHTPTVDLGTLFNNANNAALLAAQRDNTHRSLDPERAAKGLREVHMLSSAEDGSPASITLCREPYFDPTVKEERGRFGKSIPIKLHIDTSLDLANPHEITRVTLDWSGNHDPNGQPYSYSVARVIRRPEESGAQSETLTLDLLLHRAECCLNLRESLINPGHHNIKDVEHVVDIFSSNYSR